MHKKTVQSKQEKKTRNDKVKRNLSMYSMPEKGKCSFMPKGCSVPSLEI